MEKIIFGGIYIIAGLLSTFVFEMYGLSLRHHDFGFISLLSLVSIFVGIYFTIKGLCEEKKKDEEDE